MISVLVMVDWLKSTRPPSLRLNGLMNNLKKNMNTSRVYESTSGSPNLDKRLFRMQPEILLKTHKLILETMKWF